MNHWQPIEVFYVLFVAICITALFATTIGLYLLSFLKQRTRQNNGSQLELKQDEQRNSLSGISRVILTILCVLVSLCFAYALLIEPYKLSIEKIEIRTSKLKNTHFRIVQLSDLHCDETPRLETEVVKQTIQLRPDVILFCGDAVNSPKGLANFKTLLRSLSDAAPTYFAKGDWDFSFTPPLDYFGGNAAHELYNRPFKIKKNGEEIWLGGVSTGSGLVKEVLSFIPKGVFTVFAYHEPYPDIIPLNADVDLFLAGHTHGGQIVLPLVGALITRSKYGTQYVSGLYQVGKMQMFVNRGIGMEGHFPRVRFLCPPEIAVIDIEPELTKPTHD